MRQMHTRLGTGLAVLMTLALMLAACGGPQGPGGGVTVETIVPTDTPDAGAPDDGETEPTDDASGGGSLTTPHPILSDVNVRQAIAYCTDRPALIQAVYPFLDEAQQQRMLMDTFIPQGHWAQATENIQTYPFDPEKGKALLEESGWMPSEFEGEARVNEDGEALALKFTTTDANFRVTYATVLEQQLLENCGIQIIRTHAPASWWFGNATGLQRRDFELGAYAWVGEVSPADPTLYTCNQIPMPDNNWEGQNYMGWCNQEASDALIAATNSLTRDDQKRYYATVQEEFAKDMVSLPLFNRFEAAASANGLRNFKPNATETSYTINAHEWEFEDGSDTVIIGMTQEPATLFTLLEDSQVAGIVGDLLTTRIASAYDYDYQPVVVDELPTIESGGTTLEVVEVSAGDMVWSVDAEAVELAPGTRVLNSEGKIVEYTDGTLNLNQLTVTFNLKEGLAWEDGTPVTAADIQLAHDINGDPESGAISLLLTESEASFEVASDTSFTITYLPGAQWNEYFVQSPGTYAGTKFTVGAYPAHRQLADGRTLAEVPASEWSTLPEIAEQPWSYGPYKLVAWEKGQRMVFEANPHYIFGAPKIPNLIVQFYSETPAAVAALRTGDIDILGSETLGAGGELEEVITAGEEGLLTVYPLVSATWEHIDMNLFVK